jgi:hypothetical protein
MKTLLIALALFATAANAQSINRGNAIKLQGRAVAATAPTNTQLLCWDSAGSGTWKPCTGAVGGNMLLTSGATDPSGACLAGVAQYLQTVSLDEWFCAVSGTWKKKLSTTNTGTLVEVGLTGTAPATPASTFLACWDDSTLKTKKCIDDAGVVTRMMTVVDRTKTACIPIGANNAAAVIVNADLGPQSRQYMINSPQTLVEITVSADAGTPSIILGRNRAGTIVNLTSAALATAASGGLACSKGTAVVGVDGATTCSATLQNTALLAGDWITLVSGTGGGVANQMTACLTTTVN